MCCLFLIIVAVLERVLGRFLHFLQYNKPKSHFAGGSQLVKKKKEREKLQIYVIHLKSSTASKQLFNLQFHGGALSFRFGCAEGSVAHVNNPAEEGGVHILHPTPSQSRWVSRCPRDEAVLFGRIKNPNDSLAQNSLTLGLWMILTL